MKVAKEKVNPELQKVLWACYDYWRRMSIPEQERAVCYKWIRRSYQDRFGQRFHWSRLSKLADLGLLERDAETSRGGHRRYYKIPNPSLVYQLLSNWGLLRR